MNRNKKMTKIAACTLAVGALAGASAFTAAASPLAGVTGAASTNQTTVESSSYTTLAGISLTVNGILNNAANATATAETTATNTTAAAAPAATQTAQTPATTDTTDYSTLGIATVSDYVNVRSQADENSDAVGKLYANNTVTVVSDTGTGWLQITSGNVSGYVNASYISRDANTIKAGSRRVATVTTQTLYVRADASTDASVIAMVPQGDDLTVTDESQEANGWVKVSCEDGEGYVSTQFVTLSTEFTYGETKDEEAARLAQEEAERQKAAAAAKKAEDAAAAKKAAAAAKTSSKTSSKSSSKSYSAASGSSGSAVVSYAAQYVGNPYVYGGSSLTNGTDCSGYVMSVYSAFGVSLPHSSSAMRSVGYAVSQSDMQPGDIVCYSGHVGIYAGNGQIVNAANPSSGICYTNANYRSILAVRRIY